MVRADKGEPLFEGSSMGAGGEGKDVDGMGTDGGIGGDRGG